MLHLPACQMIRYKPVPLPAELDFNHTNFNNNIQPRDTHN